MARKRTTKEFMEKAKEVHGDSYDYSKVLYDGVVKPIKIYCSKHGDFLQKPKVHLEGSGCSKCAREKQVKDRTLTTKEFIRKAKIKHKNRFDYSKTLYTGTKNKIKIICPIHNTIVMNAIDHLRGTGCPKCGLSNLKGVRCSHKNNSDNLTRRFIKKAKSIHDNYYDYSLTKYKGANIDIEIICPIHGIFYQSPTNHIRGSHCQKCAIESTSMKRRKSTSDFIETAKKIHKNKYDYSKVIYENYDKKINIICKTHNVFKQTPSSHLQGRGCPKCKTSKGEMTIELHLKKQGIIFESQKRFKECINIKPLSFDFYLPNHNLLIEYQGEQHFKVIPRWGGEKRLKRQQKHDQIKRDFAKDNNINLLEISYLNIDNIEKILDKYLNDERRLNKNR